MSTTGTTLTGERADLVQTLGKHRGFLRYTVRGLTDQQAGERTTASELTLAGLIKHVAHVEANWTGFAQRGAAAFDTGNWSAEAWQAGGRVRPRGAPAGGGGRAEWRLQPGEPLAGVLAEYEEIARRTDELAATVDLDTSYALPEAPWFEPGAHWSVRRALLHIIAETAQHAGHADILRESLDGQKTMG